MFRSLFNIDYALKSLVRGSVRTLSIIIAVAIMIFFSCVAVNIWNNSESNLNDYKESRKIRGFLTDYYGNWNSELLLTMQDINNLEEITYIEDIFYSTECSYYYLGICEDLSGNTIKYEHLDYGNPKSAYRFMRDKQYFQDEARLCFTNSIENAPEFYYVDSIEMNFLEGFNQNFLNQQYQDVVYGMVSEKFRDLHHINLGDTIVVAIPEKDIKDGMVIYYEYQIRVVGSYNNNRMGEMIYCPIDVVIDTSMMKGSGDSDNIVEYKTGKNYKITNAGFYVYGIDNLLELKKILNAEGYAQIGTTTASRLFILLEDGVDLSNYINLQKHNLFLKVMIMIFIVVCFIINLFSGFLVVKNRYNEIGIWKNMGASASQIIGCFILEQVFVYFVGVFAGIISVSILFNYIAGAVISFDCLILVLTICLSYLISCLFTLYFFIYFKR